MPIYEYSCDKCGRTIEAIQRMSDKPLKTHQGCGGKLTKLISAAGFQFKGTGWYVTDYAQKAKGEGAESPKDAKDTKTEAAKPAESTEKKADKTEKVDKPAKLTSSKHKKS